MKFLAFVIVIKILGISNSEWLYKFAPVATNCQLMLPVRNYSQTVLFDMDRRGHPEIKTCIIQSSFPDKSILLLNTDEDMTDEDMTENVTRDFIVTRNNPNIIIMTKYLTSKMIESIQWKFPLSSNWSLLYIVITDDKKFKCKNDKMDTKDFSLLENIMNSLWHRLQIMRVGVAFPLACEQKMVIYNGKRPSNRILYDRSIQLINATNYNELFLNIKKSGEKLAHDYPIVAGVFYRYPTSIKECENLRYYDVHFNLNLTLGYCGLDGMVMHDILSYIKFNVSFYINESCHDYGYKSQVNVSGALGCIIRNELDISFNSRFFAQYSVEPVNFLHYIKTDELCALVKKPNIIPLWHGVFNLFSLKIWALIGATLVAIGGTMWAAAMINKTMTGPETMPFWWYLKKSVITTMLGYSPMKTRTLLMIRGACLLGSIFFLSIYLSHISRVYTTLKRFQSIKTLKDLYYSDAILYTSPSMRNFIRNLQDPEDKLQEKFFDRAYFTFGDRLGVILTKPSVTTIDRKSDAEMSIQKQYSDNHGTPLIDIVDECFYTYYLSYIARSGFPFDEDIRVLIERLNEAGLPPMYYGWTKRMLKIPNKRKENYSEPRPFFKIKLRDQRVAFGILFVGTIMSLLVFAVEIWISRRQQRLKQCKRRSRIKFMK